MSAENQTDQLKTLHRIVSAAHTAFLVTNSEKGPHGRPMVTAEVKPDLAVLYFPTERNSAKVTELANDDRVFLGYVTGGEWASISGQGRIVDNKAKNKELWTPLWKNWFSGPDDPNMVLIEVRPVTGEYWDADSKVVVAAKMAYTAVTGKKTEVGEHGKVAIS